MFGESGAPQTMKFWRLVPGDTNLITPSTASALSTLITLPHPNNLATDLFCSGHATLADGRMVLVGGAWIPLSPCREVYTLDPAWQPDVPANPTPWTASAQMAVQRWYATATTMPDGRVLASAGTMSSGMVGFGGLAKGVTMDTTWRVLQPLELATRYAWGDTTAAPGDTCTVTCVPPRFAQLHQYDDLTAGRYPPGRDAHAFVGDYSGRSIAYGGRRKLANGTFDVLGDIWNLYGSLAEDDTSHGWSFMEQIGDSTLLPGPILPQARWGCAATWAGVENRLDTQLSEVTGAVICYIHGGRDASGAVLGDLWRGERRNAPSRHYQWHWKRIFAGDASTQRFGHTLVFDPGAPGSAGAPMSKLVIFGGWKTTTQLADPTKLAVVGVGSSSTQPGVWRELTLGGAVPSARAWHAMAAKWRATGAVEREYYLFGGEAGASDSTATPVSPALWVLERPDQFSFQEDAFTWTALATSGAGPSGRSRPAMGYSVDADAIVVVGGDTTGSMLAGGQSAAIWTVQGRYTNNTITWQAPLRRSFHPEPPPIAGMGLVAIGEGRARIARSLEQFTTAASSGSGPDCGPLYGQWQALTTADSASERPIADYPNIFVLPDGRLFNAGPTLSTDSNRTVSRYKRFFNMQSKRWEEAAAGDQRDATYFGSSVMYRPGKILRAGSTSNIGTSATQTIDIGAGQTPAWVKYSSASEFELLSRTHHNLTVLPTGDVIATGGINSDDDPVATAVKRPQVWRQALARWTKSLDDAGNLELLASDPWIRNYHSTAVLLPDARVLTAGGESPSPTDDQTSASIYEPPYLFSPDGSYAARPRVMNGPDLMPYGSDFTVRLTDSTRTSTIRSIALIRPGAATHGFDQGQRYVPLEFVAREGPKRLLIHAPANGNLAPPGDYMLFVIDSLSAATPAVPSVARWVRVAATSATVVDSADVIAPRGGGYLNMRDTGQCSDPSGGSFLALNWTAPADDDTLAFTGPASLYDFRYALNASAPADFGLWTPVATGYPGALGSTEARTVSGLSTSVWYRFGVKATGDAADTSSLSNVLIAKPVQCSGGGGGFEEGAGAITPAANAAFAARPATATSVSAPSDNSVLPGATPGVTAIDALPFSRPPRLVSGSRSVYIRESGSRGLALDRIALVAIDHAAGTEAAAVPGGGVLVGSRVLPTQVSDATGADLTAPATGGSDSPVHADSGAILRVTLPAREASSEDVLLVEAAWGSVGGGGVRVDTLGADGVWGEYAAVFPRRDWSAQAVVLRGQTELRLRMRDGIAIRFVGRLGSAVRKVPTNAALVSATDASGGVWTTEASQTDGAYAIVAPLDTLSLTFADLPAAGDSLRSWFLLLQGEPLSAAAAYARAQRVHDGPPALIPTSFRLHQNIPNPFSNTTHIAFDLPKAADVNLEIYDMQGRIVHRWAGRHEAGRHSIQWDLRNTRGRPVSPGIYAYRLRAGGFEAQRKMVVIP